MLLPNGSLMNRNNQASILAKEMNELLTHFGTIVYPGALLEILDNILWIIKRGKINIKKYEANTG